MKFRYIAAFASFHKTFASAWCVQDTLLGAVLPTKLNMQSSGTGKEFIITQGIVT